MDSFGFFLFLTLPTLVYSLDSIHTESFLSVHKARSGDGYIVDETVVEEYIPDDGSYGKGGKVMDDGTVTMDASNDSDDVSSSDDIKIDSSFLIDYERDGDDMDRNKSYTVRAMLPVGELLVLATPVGCALLDSQDDVSSTSSNLEPLEFTFKIADLEDCAKLTDSIIENLQSEIIEQWDNIQNESKTCKSSTTLQDVAIRKHGKSSSESSDFDSFKTTSSKNESANIKKMASAFLATHLSLDLLPTTLEGAFVFHFNLVDDPVVDSKFDDLMNLLNKSPEELKRLQEEYKKKLEDSKNILSDEISQGKTILDELSQHGIDTVECYQLNNDDCAKYSKCGIVSIDGKEHCFVSPKTIFWLMETNCGLQSKSALFTIAKDLVSAKIMSESQYETLRQSYDVSRICNSITHSYLSSNIVTEDDHPFKKAFDL